MKNATSILTQCLLVAVALCLSFASAAQITFTDQTSALSDPTHYSGNALAIHDVNNDGLDDLVILDGANQLTIEFQQADGTWISYLGGFMDNQNAWNVVVGDLTNNGIADVISGVNGENPDYARANADGTDWVIEDLEDYPLFAQGASMADIDQDGDLDLYVCGDVQESAIWANDGEGGMTFSGTDLIDLTVEGWDGSGNYASVFSDFDHDGDLDLYVSHCRQGVTDATDPRRINQLFENDGNNNYTENADAYGLAIGAQSWTTDFGDIDNDGDFDMFITNHDVPNMVLENLDDSDQYEDIFDSAIGEQQVGFPLQGIFKDFDNDGFLDIIVTGNSHALYHNNGDKTFTYLPDAFGGPSMLSMAVGDLNHDGFLDVYGSYGQIYNNPSNTPDRVWINDGNDNNFLTVVLEGTISNVDAVGAMVSIYGTWGVQVREVRAGESYGINNSLHAHFGLGQSSSVDSLIIEWPSSGITDVIYQPDVNQFITVVEDQCVSPTVAITVNGENVLCAGESVELDAEIEGDYEYLWSNGDTGSSITVTEAGSYTVEVTEMGTECTGVAPSVSIISSPDETPTLAISGDLTFCEGGAVTITSSESDSYLWSNGDDSQSIEVTEAGEYSVSIEGACQTWSSETVEVNVVDIASVNVIGPLVEISSGQTAMLEATGTGDEIRWYANETDTEALASGDTYTTEPLFAGTSFWAESVNVIGGGSAEGGKENNSNGVYHGNDNFYLEFDAYQDMILNSVKVYTDAPGMRTIRLLDADGDLVTDLDVNIPAGETVVDLDFFVEEGNDYSLRGTGDHGMWRDEDDANVNFPYSLGTDIGEITGTNVSNNNADVYYYYYYDWQVSLPETLCASDREEVTVEILVGLSEGEAYADIQVFPNPTSAELNISFGADIKAPVQLSLTDLAGRQVMAEQINAVASGQLHVLDLEHLGKGVYILELRSEEGHSSQRIEVK